MGMHLLYEENKESRREIALLKNTLKFYENMITDTLKQSYLDQIAELENSIKRNNKHILKWGD